VTRPTRLLRGLLIAALLIAVLVPTSASAAGGRAPRLKGVFSRYLPERNHGTSVAIGPDGIPWFGIESAWGPALAHIKAQRLSLRTPRGNAVKSRGSERRAATYSPRFDPEGNLWFIRNYEVGSIVRRAPDGTLSEFNLPAGGPPTSLTIGPGGDIWFTRAADNSGGGATIGRMTPAGAVTEFPLTPTSRPSSIIAGPDGALWFVEQEKAGQIGRVTTSGEVTLFPLGPEVEPRQIVAGPDGALWFSESGEPGPQGKSADRIGRITTSGEVRQLPIPFGESTEALAADPRGQIWFTTQADEISSISTSGSLGARGCINSCATGILSIALAPSGALWFAGSTQSCSGCGGEAGLLAENAGTALGKIPAGALRPAVPEGSPAEGAGEIPLPTARTLKPYGVNGTEAVLYGLINPHGYPATFRFKWGRTKKYGHLAPDESPEQPVSPFQEGEEIEEIIGGLCPKTTYHFEIVAYGAGGTTFGGDRTFRTTASKHPPKHCPK
jgi:virginiamycin B lyase